MSARVTQVLAIVAAWVWFGGCAAFEPRADPSSYYILGALPEADFAADKNPAGVKANFSVGLGPIELPGYLDRQQIATRTSTNRLSYSETDRWAAPLAESFSRVLGQNISHLLNPAQVIQFPWQSSDATGLSGENRGAPIRGQQRSAGVADGALERDRPKQKDSDQPKIATESARRIVGQRRFRQSVERDPRGPEP